ncbi:hypothetical protein [Corynebacterium sp.]|uniref:hypothetical protein n=1 Tax=Corynebacterium sp. TaxID=1720 RepID=UPI0019B85897|nr:hypothetical protein [Corynebacterium sp.]HHU66893.1 hypothetical protein [Corynebacterium sp.]HKM25479.1 hypothetical protein [Corynebacterium sp.]
MYRGELRGEFIRLARGHFIGTSVYEDLDEDEKEVVRIAAHACCAPTTLVVGRSAALLWELPVVDEPEKRATRKVELGAVGGRTSSSGALRYRSLHRVHEDGAETTDTDFGSLRLTDVLTTALDLARWSSLRDSVRSLDLGLQTGQFTFADMDTRVAEMAGVKGISSIRQAARLASEGSESPAETDAKLLFRELGIPRPLQQVVLTGRRGSRIGRVDYFFPDHGLVLEIDGDVKYSLIDPGDNSIRLKEYRQTLEYLRNGLRLMRFSCVDLETGLASETIGAFFSADAAPGLAYPGHLWRAEGGPAWRD